MLLNRECIVRHMLHLKSKYWIEGYALAMYSSSYNFIEGQSFTALGEAVHKFKYWKLLPQDRDRLQEFCVKSMHSALIDKFGTNPPFNFIVAVPANRKEGLSIPPLMSKDLAARSHGKLLDATNSLTKLKELPSMKNLSKDEKVEVLSDAYFFTDNLPKPIKGILILDDIFDSGTTLRFVARAINLSCPDVPKYVMTLTALRSNY